MKKALILGVTGQDGSYLADILLEKGYEVHGLYRHSATGNTKNIDHIPEERLTLHRGDLQDLGSIRKAIERSQPDEIYNEADQDHVQWSFATPAYSYDVTGAAVGKILETVKDVNKNIRFFQPVSSNIFGIAPNPQTEQTPFNPQSPYAAAKAFAAVLSKFYRDVHGMFVSTGIFYNHESPRRTEEYVTRKITRSAARIAKGLQQKMDLGSLDQKIDFGYAREYMDAAHSIMQLPKADDFIICTGELHSVKEFLDESFKAVGMSLHSNGKTGVEEQYLNQHGKTIVETNPKFFRPGNTSSLLGDNSKARKAFGFDPQVKFKNLVQILIEHDLKDLEQK